MTRRSGCRRLFWIALIVRPDELEARMTVGGTKGVQLGKQFHVQFFALGTVL